MRTLQSFSERAAAAADEEEKCIAVQLKIASLHDAKMLITSVTR